jgi:hypothetical protein
MYHLCFDSEFANLIEQVPTVASSTTVVMPTSMSVVVTESFTSPQTVLVLHAAWPQLAVLTALDKVCVPLSSGLSLTDIHTT